MMFYRNSGNKSKVILTFFIAQEVNLKLSFEAVFEAQSFYLILKIGF